MKYFCRLFFLYFCAKIVNKFLGNREKAQPFFIASHKPFDGTPQP
jgi:hypothetical protein